MLGFLVLFLTFAGVAGYAIHQMNRLGHDLQFIRAAYLDIAPRVASLQAMQATVVDYLDEPRPSQQRVDKNRKLRLSNLEDIAKRLGALTDMPRGYAPQLEVMRERATTFQQEIMAGEVLSAAALGADRTTEAAATALSTLKKREGKLDQNIKTWEGQLQRNSIALVTYIGRKEYQARVLGMVLGGIAGVLAMLVTFWAVMTLRPLARLRDGARRVARGDYRGRVEAVGGTEVADLANEFNAMAAAIEEREQDLVRSERLAAVGKMAAVITHEVRNPLSSLGLNAELLEEELGKVATGGSPAEAAGLLAAMHKEIDRLTAITEEYLRFARLPRPRLEPEQVNGIVSGLVEFQKEELGLLGVNVQARLEDGMPLVACDEGQLRQALLNLVRNAAEAMAGNGGGELTVTTRRADAGGVEVRVADTGPGIAAEHLPKIFEPFFSTKDGGTGLGLALTQQIIAEHGGRIDVESTPGRGTTFVVKLPAAAPQ